MASTGEGEPSVTPAEVTRSYKLHGVIGTVAEHARTGIRVVVKIVKKSREATQMLREINILRQLRHRHIVTLHEVIETPEYMYVVMEHVSGGELFDFIVRNDRLPEPAARRIFQELVSALDYCHHHKVVHRDLKPENILLTSKGSVKVADFGFANFFDEKGFLSTSCGSPHYAAPEVIDGRQYPGPCVDVWSCGVILFVLVCGAVPFDNDNIVQLFSAIRTANYKFPEHVQPTPELKDLIQRMLTVDPTKRITLAEVRRHPWFLVDLPEALKGDDEDFVPDERDAVVLDVAACMGASPSEVVRALASEKVNDLTVAYSIVKSSDSLI